MLTRALRPFNTLRVARAQGRGESSRRLHSGFERNLPGYDRTPNAPSQPFQQFHVARDQGGLLPPGPAFELALSLFGVGTYGERLRVQ